MSQSKIDIQRLSLYLTGRMPPYYNEGIAKGKFYNLLKEADPSFEEEIFNRLIKMASSSLHRTRYIKSS